MPALDVAHLPSSIGATNKGERNDQSRESFAAEAAAIIGRQRRLVWLAPSRDESSPGPVLTPEAMEIWATSEASEPDDEVTTPSVQGGRERGLILHKLLEEVLTGETADDAAALTGRASVLIGALGRPVADDPATGLSPHELAGCVTRTLVLPEIVELRPTLSPEYPVYAAAEIEGGEQATAGITDATSFGPDGMPQSRHRLEKRCSANTETVDHYRAQVRNYLDMTGSGARTYRARDDG